MGVSIISIQKTVQAVQPLLSLQSTFTRNLEAEVGREVMDVSSTLSGGVSGSYLVEAGGGMLFIGFEQSVLEEISGNSEFGRFVIGAVLRVSSLLDERNLRFGVFLSEFNDPEDPSLSVVVIKFYVEDKKFEEVLSIWEEASTVAREGMPIQVQERIRISFDARLG